MIEIKKTRQLENLLSARHHESCVEMEDLENGVFHFSTMCISKPLVRIGEVISQIIQDNPDLEIQFVTSQTRQNHLINTSVLVRFVSKEDLYQEFKRKVHPVKCI